MGYKHQDWGSYLLALFVDPEAAEDIIPEEAKGLSDDSLYIPPPDKLPFYHAGYEARIRPTWMGGHIDDDAFEELKREFAADKSVPEDAGLRDFPAAATAPQDSGYILSPALEEEMGAAESSEVLFMEPFLDTDNLMSGLTTARLTDASGEESFFLGTSTLLHVRAYALELVVYENVDLGEEISPDQVRGLKARTLDWAEAILANWSSRLPALEEETLRQFSNPIRLLRLAGVGKWPILVLGAGVAVLIFHRRFRLPPLIQVVLGLLPAEVGLIVFYHDIQRNLRLEIEMVGPLWSPMYDDGVSSGFTEPISLLILGGSASVLLVLLTFVQWKGRKNAALQPGTPG